MSKAIDTLQREIEHSKDIKKRAQEDLDEVLGYHDQRVANLRKRIEAADQRIRDCQRAIERLR